MTAVDSHSSVARCTFDHHDSGIRGDDYYPIYEQLRTSGVAWSDHSGGFWVVADYDDARAVLKDHSSFSSADGCFLPDMGYRSVALEQDPPEHTLFRKLFVSAVGRGAVVRHEAALEAMIRRIVGEFVAAGGGDAREMISERIPVEAVALMFGLSAPAAARVRELTTEAWKRIATDPNAMAPMTEMLLGEVASRRAEPRDDFLTLLLGADINGRPLTEAEIGNVLVGAVIAGHETTMNASTNLLHELAQNPDLQERLRKQPDEIPAAVEECLRHRAPIHLFFRTATAAVSLRGAQIQPGDKVAVLYASANRDPARFAAAERFDVCRDDNAHLSFGWGIHRCVGAYLAQTELRLLTRVLLDAAAIVPDGEPKSAPLEGGHHMGFKYLPLKVVPNAPSGDR
jgi:cytochrome P450